MFPGFLLVIFGWLVIICYKNFVTGDVSWFVVGWDFCCYWFVVVICCYWFMLLVIFVTDDVSWLLLVVIIGLSLVVGILWHDWLH